METTYSVDILGYDRVEDDLLVLLEKAVKVSLKMLAVPSTSLSLLLTDNERMRQLNFDFRQVDSPTDVLSFPANIELPDVADHPHYLGDIAISVPYALNQAQMSGHTLAAELQLLAIHGVLHLLGYDHLDQDEKNKMWSLQEMILGKLGLSNIAPTEG